MAPRKRQTMLFSATFSEEVQKLVALSLRSPVRLAADAAGAAPRSLRQEIVRLKARCFGALVALRLGGRRGACLLGSANPTGTHPAPPPPPSATRNPQP